METVIQAFVFPGLLYVLVWTVGLFWFFRKFMAPLHKRVGPYFNGPHGSYQTLFDLSKLLTKESITPKGVNPYLFSIMPLLAVITAMLPAAFIPWTESTPVPLGRGFTDGAHGRIPLPAPATVALLEGAPVRPSEVDAETVTPTGAALLAELADAWGPVPEMTLQATG